ncbi:MAG TPA: hypothetical protein DHW82_09215 [Spirochaetia bacterium]|nr:MAG: hypothetical protein A2Y41_08800 [Spirochaetes bacterium GWB1_36_13]HCL57169.1 hypothetical protein [Spirochaetia bacterium]
MKKTVFILSFLFFAFPLYSDTVRITQIDSSSLLVSQIVRLYTIVTDSEGNPVKNLSKENFKIWESDSSAPERFKPIQTITDFKSASNYQEGISFLLLVDNSGSMYWTMDGKKTKNNAERRITFAKEAILSFLKTIQNPKDSIGLIAYNSFYHLLSAPVRQKIEIESLLEKIQKPEKDEVFTEIYSTLTLAAEDFKTLKGRKAILILSDGENAPYTVYTKKEHPVFKKKIVQYSEVIEKCQIEGISVFVINFGNEKDKELYKIAKETGGAVFDANNAEELKQIYQKIGEQILSEYILSYPAAMDPADRKFVKLQYTSSNQETSETVRFYFSSPVFGLPITHFNPLFLIPIALLAFFLLYLLSRIKLENKVSAPSLELLYQGNGSTVSAKTLLLTQEKTIIGNEKHSNLTILNKNVKENSGDVTIAFDQKTQCYTLVAEKGVTINNKVFKTKVLNNGDLIQINGAGIVFDKGVDLTKAD